MGEAERGVEPPEGEFLPEGVLLWRGGGEKNMILKNMIKKNMYVYFLTFKI